MKPHRMWAVWIVCITLLIVSAQMGHSQNDLQYFTSFLDRQPTSEDLSRVPSHAKDIVVAKVRLISTYGFVGRHGESFGAHPRDARIGAELVVTEFLSGDPAIGRQDTMMGPRYQVVFMRPGAQLRHTRPHTPGQKMLEYFIVSYGSDDQWRRLIEFPITKQKFEEWEKEVRAYERERGRYGGRP